MDIYLLAVAVVTLTYMLMTFGLNLQYGFTGLINFGLVGFFAIGAYTSALLVMAGVPLLLGFAAAALLAALAAWPVALLSLRLRIEYFAIVMLGFSETIRLIITNERWLTGGVQGIPGIPSAAAALGITGVDPNLVTLALLVVAVGLVLAINWRLVNSPFGRMIQAIRDDEEAVRSLGKQPGRFKVAVFMVGSAFAGLSGAFYAHYITYITPEQFVPLLTFYVWVAMIFGGSGRVSGAAIGTIVLIGFLEGSRFLRDVVPGISEVEMASLRLGVVGVALMLLMRFRPDGILGARAGRA
ncbi:branched-chain amino acid ABC transporter permease [Tistrella bauzanensis]|uniref:Branched-chain amino acid ABC transporter permease n=1 Tax=Tistrella bauzanensis TaxID=657419 RepID=A0ABQ1IBC3_9PROT|nr:branched-chain amino acid ABC transporter permease [Tistrella bauzanensis]GGB31349.1 branched-chain amino acid ABC transporter permease [Tistrella bauzanensis]